MANIEYEDFVTSLTEETTPDNASDFLVIVDTSGSDVNKVKPSNILGTDLTAIKALTPSNDDVLQRKAGAWTNRTIAQLTTDLAITPNATHTGEVTGATALTVDKTAITNKTLVTAAVGDHVLVADASDSDALKKVTVQTIVDLAAGGIAIGGTVTGATPGSVFFAGALGVLAQDNTNLFWDDAANKLRVPYVFSNGTSLVLEQTGDATGVSSLTLMNGTSGASYGAQFYNAGIGLFDLQFEASGANTGNIRFEERGGATLSGQASEMQLGTQGQL
ncbi:MAG: hypothetical protein IPK58_22060, partial [Acidobacteria bacterium]|nr:hypothetical protein [Acidobacteriota bacterium]